MARNDTAVCMLVVRCNRVQAVIPAKRHSQASYLEFKKFFDVYRSNRGYRRAAPLFRARPRLRGMMVDAPHRYT
eukprot:6208304-Pleurochrysis_carterae.AAC.5